MFMSLIDSSAVTCHHAGTANPVQQVENAVHGHHANHHGPHTATTPAGVVHQVENAVTGHGTNAHRTHGAHGNTTPAGVVHQVENTVTGHGTHGTHAHGTHGTHTGPAGLIHKAKV